MWDWLRGLIKEDTYDISRRGDGHVCVCKCGKRPCHEHTWWIATCNICGSYMGFVD